MLGTCLAVEMSHDGLPESFERDSAMRLTEGVRPAQLQDLVGDGRLARLRKPVRDAPVFDRLVALAVSIRQIGVVELAGSAHILDIAIDRFDIGLGVDQILKVDLLTARLEQVYLLCGDLVLDQELPPALATCIPVENPDGAHALKIEPRDPLRR